MLSFLQPIWLYAISGIIIPIAIHFWNIKEGRAFPVGSIALLEKSKKKYTRTLRINEWLLLALRCLLIILLAVLLAKPVKQQSFNNSRGWILIDKQNAGDVYNHFKTTIDSLLNKGFELHQFDESFERTSLKNALNSKDTTAREISYWKLIKEADNKLPASFPVYVFTSNRLKDFKGERPQVNINVKWFAYAADAATKQLVKAWLGNDGDIHVMLNNSSASGNVFSYEDVPPGKIEGGEYLISSNNGQSLIAYNHQPLVVVDTAALHISIYPGEYKQDANYIKAALDAIKGFTKQNIEIIIFNSTVNLPQKTNWLFWLSDDAIPNNITAEKIFRYVKGKEVDESSVISANSTMAKPIAINKIIIADSLKSKPGSQIWKDGFGNPLLTNETNNNIDVYNFYSHFNPQWNDLVWSDAFPSMLLHLIFEDEIAGINKLYADERVMDEKQIQAAFHADANKKIISAKKDVSTVFWLIIFLLFCAERIISFRTKTSAAV